MHLNSGRAAMLGTSTFGVLIATATALFSAPDSGLTTTDILDIAVRVGAHKQLAADRKAGENKHG